MGQTTRIEYTSNSKDVTFTLRTDYTDFKLSGKNVWGHKGEVRVKLWGLLHYYTLGNFMSLFHWTNLNRCPAPALAPSSGNSSDGLMEIWPAS